MIAFFRKLASKNKLMASIVYIGYILYETLRKLLFLMLRVFPVQKNKIVISAMQGSRYGDNPFYISEVLRKKNKYDIVWLLKPGCEHPEDSDIRFVDAGNMFAVSKELATAAVWIDSNHKHSGFLKRKNQIFIQTWHGSYGLKKIGFDLGKNLSLIDRRNLIYNSKYQDVMVSNSKRTSEIYRTAFGFSGEIIEKGSPRNDMLLDTTVSYDDKVRNYYSLNEDVRLVLYAPTFRSDYRTDTMKLDFSRLKSDLEKKYGGTWVVLIRLHYKNMEDSKDFINYSDCIKNATDYPVMQELLAVCDVLVTDYSSCMFDFATTRKPCFIYASDLQKYTEDRGNYFAMNELPFPMADTNDKLEGIISDFDEKQYNQNLDGLFKTVGLNETGHASEAVARYIEDWIDREKV